MVIRMIGELVLTPNLVIQLTRSSANVQEFEKIGGPVILLEHDVREATIEVAEAVSQHISPPNRVNCPISAAFGDRQRYQGTKLTWPVAGPNGFDSSSSLKRKARPSYVALLRLDYFDFCEIILLFCIISIFLLFFVRRNRVLPVRVSKFNIV